MPNFDWDDEFAGIIESEELDLRAEWQARQDVCAEIGHTHVKVDICSRCFEAFGLLPEESDEG